VELRTHLLKTCEHKLSSQFPKFVKCDFVSLRFKVSRVKPYKQWNWTSCCACISGLNFYAFIHDFWDVNLNLSLQYTFTDVHLCLIKMFGLEPSPCSIYIPPPSPVLCTLVFYSGKCCCFVIQVVFT